MVANIMPADTDSERILHHLLMRIDATPAIHVPFTHIYLDSVFPPDVYQKLLCNLPDPNTYRRACERHYGRADGGFVRSMFHLMSARVTELPVAQCDFWKRIATSLMAPQLKTALFKKLARDLAFRYGISEKEASGLAGYARPTLYRETDGYEIAPHPDTRRKVVTMQIYLPADNSQLALGTALYRRRILALPIGSWHHRFAKVKQFPFAPNSGYAFVVNNALRKKSWHGREELPPGSGVRNTLLNTFYDTPKAVFAA